MKNIRINKQKLYVALAVTGIVAQLTCTVVETVVYIKTRKQ